MQQRIFSPENSEGVVQVYTAEQEAAVKTASEQGRAKVEEEKAKALERENLKASAKQKLMNGEALTEDEANVMVGL